MPSVKDDLPEPPEPAIKDEADLLAELGAGAFTADQMQSYARLAVQQAVLVERERCAKLCEAAQEMYAALHAIDDEFVDPLEPWGPDLELPRDWLLGVREVLAKYKDVSVIREGASNGD